MARKSAKAVSGSNLVLSALGSQGRIAFVLLAEDVSTGIADKVIGKADRMKIPCFRLLTKDFMGQVMGKGERSVIALASGPLAKAIMIELVRYKQIVGES
jgi:ribosomal protein L7Ae-like RNA K-turn-binding protein